TGAPLDHLKSALSSAAQESSPKISPLLQKYQHFRLRLGHKIEKKSGNHRFFDAPVAGIVCMDKELGRVYAISVRL
ncbi:hypothetical protein K469DRAFT_806087, partial [Zopfia rhizophila CBS 207.26]